MVIISGVPIFRIFTVMSTGLFKDIIVCIFAGEATAQFPAELMYHTQPDSVIGLRGKSVSFKCIFGGK